MEHGDEHVYDASVDVARLCLEVARGLGEGVALLRHTVQTLEFLHLQDVDALVLRVLQNVPFGHVQLLLQSVAQSYQELLKKILKEVNN